MIVEFRRRTLLPLDDVLGCLRHTIPRLTRSALHRCLRRHGISRLPESEDKTSRRGRFAETAIGYVHIDICELRLAAGKLHMFLAIDRVSKFTYVEFHEHQTGSLTPGKWADIAVLSRDIMTVPPDSILGTKVLYTIVGGKVVYSAARTH